MSLLHPFTCQDSAHIQHAQPGPLRGQEAVKRLALDMVLTGGFFGWPFKPTCQCKVKILQHNKHTNKQARTQARMHGRTQHGRTDGRTQALTHTHTNEIQIPHPPSGSGTLAPALPQRSPSSASKLARLKPSPSVGPPIM